MLITTAYTGVYPSNKSFLRAAWRILFFWRDAENFKIQRLLPCGRKPDFALRREKLAIEIDRLSSHRARWSKKDPTWDRDRDRDKRLMANGWTVLHILHSNVEQDVRACVRWVMQRSEERSGACCYYNPQPRKKKEN